MAIVATPKIIMGTVWAQLVGVPQDRLFDRFVPRIRSSAELTAMNSRMPDTGALYNALIGHLAREVGVY
jgi:hypothetical protein